MTTSLWKTLSLSSPTIFMRTGRPSSSVTSISSPSPFLSCQTAVFSSTNAGTTSPDWRSNSQGFAFSSGVFASVSLNWNPPRSISASGTPSTRGRVAWYRFRQLASSPARTRNG